MEHLQADIDDEGTVFLRVGGGSVPIVTPDRIRAPHLIAKGPAKPARPTRWPPVVIYARDPTATGLVKVDLRELLTVEVDDIDRLVGSVQGLPWAGRHAELLVSVRDGAAEAAMEGALRRAMGPASPQLLATRVLGPPADD